MERWKLDDTLQSVMAQTHHVQNRLLQSSGKGRMSDETAAQCANLLRNAASRLEELNNNE